MRFWNCPISEEQIIHSLNIFQNLAQTLRPSFMRKLCLLMQKLCYHADKWDAFVFGTLPWLRQHVPNLCYELDIVVLPLDARQSFLSRASMCVNFVPPKEAKIRTNQKPGPVFDAVVNASSL